MGKRIRIAIVALASVLLLVCTPLFWYPPRGATSLEEIAAHESAPFHGVLQVWLLGGWNLPYGSRTTLVEEAITRYQKAHLGSYVQLRTIHFDDLERLVQQGRSCDIVLCPAARAQQLPFALCDLPARYALRQPFDAALGRDTRFLPYLAGQITLLGNEKLLQKYDLAAQSGADLLTHLAMQSAPDAALALWGTAKVLQPWGRAGETAALRLGEYADLWPLFRAGQVAWYVGTRYEQRILDTLQQKGTGFSYRSTWPDDWPKLLDVHYACVTQSDPLRQEACFLFLETLLQPRFQRDALLRMGAVPVVELQATEDWNAADRSTYAACDGARYLPAAVAWESLLPAGDADAVLLP